MNRKKNTPYSDLGVFMHYSKVVSPSANLEVTPDKFIAVWYLVKQIQIMYCVYAPTKCSE